MKHRYNQYSSYIKNKYGQRVQKIPVDAGFTCPNRDGTLSVGGCIYCNNSSFSRRLLSPLTLSEQIKIGIEVAKKKYKVDKFFIYFQSFTNTYACLDYLKEIYQTALAFEGVVGLCIGTRPDCIDKEKLDFLEDLTEKFDITIEYGLESVYDLTLSKINRGHNFQAFENAINLTLNRNIQICTHIILGFPWESSRQWIETAKILSKYPIDFLKVHNLHVVRETKLFEIFQESPFKTLGAEEYLEIIIEFLENLNPQIIIQRLLSDTPIDLLISPRWEIKNSTFLNNLLIEMSKRNTYQGRLYENIPS
ncbi:MAG: TIGR01212 family radical SAM protein [Bdellovibrionales bacterium RIFOXYB1_FULL_37_110]|nr:MAG: TIGR01212 family radical SAM protein [Bdellovibrionales bacterium RIFOXYC1_FULL_37_79]OFZ60684.1 MAG: TIGR01212 family radical SAM protein [Bdellovibrionales bacterium RIFOXYB1_FULL_37_110]OFZ64436.1 MAG: TIGR01212 family radical SAM protein [Bdellovibrionales bacterium RIFOXYD1_FULL_36_51]